MTAIPTAERALKRSGVWMAIGLLLMAGVYVRALVFTPEEATQGLAQKIFYIHAPSAWVAFLAFGVVGICSAIYLFVKDPRLDLLAASSAEVGTVFTTVVLVTGPIWGKTVWGAWWTWDARLTSTLFLYFIYLAYLVLRSAVDEPGRRARYSAVLGILGALLVPFIHVSVYLFRTLHPMPVVLRPGKPELPGSMLLTLLSSFVVFTVFYLALLARRYAWARLVDARAQSEADRADASR
ncbi:MAG TPA: cytochrome c biogenesis protein CcsA [Gemmatimonadales bacterium]|nr:cytochrome c biogenesis protein CcsA [Gemmatimonadales bacterium]